MIRPHIKREWIVSRAARRVYFSGSVLTLLVLATLLGTNVALEMARADLSSSPVLAALLRPFLFLGAVGAAVTYVAMWYFWFSFDESGWLKKFVWFLVLAFLSFPGSAFYCFFVYCRSKVFQSKQMEAASGM